MEATVSGRARSRSRSMNRVPLPAVSVPATGQCRISAFASMRAGRTAASSGMSSHEMWLATRSSPPVGVVVPVMRSRMPADRTIVRHHQRTATAGIRLPTG